MNEENIKGYEGNKGMSKEEAAERLRRVGGLEVLGFGSQPLPHSTERLETDVTKVWPPMNEEKLREALEKLLDKQFRGPQPEAFWIGAQAMKDELRALLAEAREETPEDFMAHGRLQHNRIESIRNKAREIDLLCTALDGHELATCSSCGWSWEIQRVHVIRRERTPEGFRELVCCPKCDHIERVFRPAIANSNRD